MTEMSINYKPTVNYNRENRNINNYRREHMSIEVFNKMEAKMKELGVDKEIISKVVEFSRHEVPEEFRSKEDYKKLKNEYETFKTTAQEKEEIISNLKQKAQTAEEYEAMLNKTKEQLEEKDKEWAEKFKKEKFESALDKRIANDPDILPKARDTFKLLLPKDKLSLDGENLIGYDDVSKTVKEQNDYLLNVKKFEGQGTQRTTETTQELTSNPFKSGEFFSLTKQAEILKNDKAKAKILIKQAGGDPSKFNL